MNFVCEIGTLGAYKKVIRPLRVGSPDHSGRYRNLGAFSFLDCRS